MGPDILLSEEDSKQIRMGDELDGYTMSSIAPPPGSIWSPTKKAHVKSFIQSFKGRKKVMTAKAVRRSPSLKDEYAIEMHP